MKLSNKKSDPLWGELCVIEHMILIRWWVADFASLMLAAPVLNQGDIY